MNSWYAFLILAIAFDMTPSLSGVRDALSAPPQLESLDRGRLSITVLPRGPEPTIAVSKISAHGTVVGLAPPEGNILRWLPGARAPENLGGGPSFLLLNRLPLIAADGAIIAADHLKLDENGRAIGMPSTWDRNTGWQTLPGLKLRTSHVVGMSRNGRRMVGYGWNEEGEPAQPWLWSVGHGQHALPVMQPSRGGEAWAASNDGRVVVGHQFDVPDLPNPRRRYYATRWANGKVRELTDSIGAVLGQAFSCSNDCSVIVGGGQGGDPDLAHPNFGQAWYWTETTGGVYLGSRPDAAPATTYYATDVNRDGSMIIGTYYRLNDDGSVSYRGFLWTPATGLVSILELMSEHGIEYASNWRRVVPTAITAAGDMILVAGLDANFTTAGFILHLPHSQARAVMPRPLAAAAPWRGGRSRRRSGAPRGST